MAAADGKDAVDAADLLAALIDDAIVVGGVAAVGPSGAAVFEHHAASIAIAQTATKTAAIVACPGWLPTSHLASQSIPSWIFWEAQSHLYRYKPSILLVGAHARGRHHALPRDAPPDAAAPTTDALVAELRAVIAGLRQDRDE
jgi:hypothetical protein